MIALHLQLRFGINVRARSLPRAGSTEAVSSRACTTTVVGQFEGVAEEEVVALAIGGNQDACDWNAGSRRGSAPPFVRRSANAQRADGALAQRERHRTHGRILRNGACRRSARGGSARSCL